MHIDMDNRYIRTGKLSLKPRRTLKGHFAKIYAMHWCATSAPGLNGTTLSTPGPASPVHIRIRTGPTPATPAPGLTGLTRKSAPGPPVGSSLPALLSSVGFACGPVCLFVYVFVCVPDCLRAVRVPCGFVCVMCVFVCAVCLRRSETDRNLVSASQDGKLIVWNVTATYWAHPKSCR